MKYGFLPQRLISIKIDSSISKFIFRDQMIGTIYILLLRDQANQLNFTGYPHPGFMDHFHWILGGIYSIEF